MAPDLPFFARAFRLQAQGNARGARQLCRSALARDPGCAEAYHFLGALDAQREHWAGALRFFRRALALNPREASYYNSMALAFWALGRKYEAFDALESGLKLSPGNVPLIVHRARLLARFAQPSIAIPALEHAAKVAPDPLPLRAALAGALGDAGRLQESGACWNEILSVRPDDPAGLNNLAGILCSQGKVEEALQLYRRVGRKQPAAASNLLLILHYSTEITPERLFREHKRWAQRLKSPAAGTPAPRILRRRRLRIGYVSGDFRLHSVSYGIDPLLRNHDPDRVQVHLFSNAPNEDGVTARFRKYAHAWHGITGVDDEQVAAAVRRAGIDILVDLSGHTAYNRLPLFALRPAPIQVNYLGYPNTTGLRAIDYRITDSIADPPGRTEHLHTETLVRLDPCFLCYQPRLGRMPVGRAPYGRRGCVTLASFAIRQKLNPPLLESWAEILGRAPNTRLILKCRALLDGEVGRELREFFKARGIAAGRLSLLQSCDSLRDHLARYGSVDLMLDTFPYNGTTMTCEALWMGVPTLTWSGDVHVSRVGETILRQVAMEDLITTSRDEYVARAVELAGRPERLAEWRRQARNRMRHSPLRDGNRLARDMEAAYVRMWRA